MKLKKTRKASLVLIVLMIVISLIYQWTIVSSDSISNDVFSEKENPLTTKTNPLSNEPIQDSIIETSITEIAEPLCQPIVDQENHWKENYQLVNDYLNQAATEETQQMLAIIGTESMLGINAKTDEEIDNINEEKINRLSKATNDYPDNRLLNYHFIDICSTNPNNKNCSDENIDKAIKLDGSNGALWSNIASIYIAQKNIDAAIDALQQSSAAPTFNDFRMQRISFFNSTISRSGIAQHESMVISLGYEAAIAYYALRNISEFCSKKPLSRIDVAYSCLEYGKRLEQDSNTMIFTSMGLSYQRIAFENLNENVEVARVINKKKLMRKSFEDSLIDDSMFLYDIEFQEYWLQVMTNHNELDAFALLKKEAERLKSDPNFSPCPIN